MTEQKTCSISEFQQKAHEGDAQAQFDLALCYANDLALCNGEGEEIEKNVALALELVKNAAEQGLISAQLSLGLYYFVDTNLDNLLAGLANAWVKAMFGTTEKHVLSLVFLLYQQKPDRETKLNGKLAFKWFQHAAKQGGAEAQYWLARCYFEGIGVEPQYDKAVDWFKKATEQNIVNANYWLARCYLDGKGVEQNYESTFVWLIKGVEQSVDFLKTSELIRADPDYYSTLDDSAYLLLGDLYAQGKGIEQNNTQAFKWYKKVSDSSSIPEKELNRAYLFLARCYEQGLGVEKNIFLAEQYYDGVSEDAETAYRFAKYYLYSDGVKKDYKIGMKWLIKAIELNHIDANQWLEETYLNFVFPYFSGRENIGQCYKFAYEWLSKAFEENPRDHEVNFGLGILYAFGKGIEKNREKAINYFYQFESGDGIDYINDEPDLLEYFSQLFCCIYKDDFEHFYYPNELAPAFVERKYISIRRGKPFMLLPVLRIDFHSRAGEFELLKALLNDIDGSESVFSHHSSTNNNFKIMTSTVTQQAEVILEKNKELEEKNKQLQVSQVELEDMMSMFAHKFRSPLDAIIYNTQHENQVALYTEAAQTMRGLLNIFSIISTDADILIDKIKQDYQGSGQLEAVFSKTLDMILLHLLSVSGAEKIQQHYLSYAKTHNQCDAQVSYKTWCEEYFELEQVLQSDWETSYAQLLNQTATLEQRLDWLEEHFFKLEIVGFERADIQFKEYGITESLLTILLNEILVNTFKYYSSASKQPVVLEWIEREGYQVLVCSNPSVRSERTIIKGSHKGHVFLSTLARKTGSLFTKPRPEDNFVLEFGIPNELLISK